MTSYSVDCGRRNNKNQSLALSHIFYLWCILLEDVYKNKYVQKYKIQTFYWIALNTNHNIFDSDVYPPILTPLEGAITSAPSDEASPTNTRPQIRSHLLVKR